MKTEPPVPPRFTERVLGWAFHPDDRPFALADLAEEFAERAARDGGRSARWWYRRQAVASFAHALRGRFVRRGAPGHASTEGDWFTALGSDLRFGGRGLLRAPMTSLLTVLSLGTGLGGVTIVLALVHGFVFETPAGLEDPEGIVSVYRTDPGGHPYGNVAYADFLDLRGEVAGLEGVAASATTTMSLAGAFVPVSVLGEATSGNFFELTGMRPILGRVYDERSVVDDHETRVAVLGHALWRSRFDGRPDVVGSTVRIDGLPFTVIGVGPEGVRGRRVPLETDVWIPLGSLQTSGVLPAEARTDRTRRNLSVLGRLSPGASLETVQGQADVLAARLEAEYERAWSVTGDQAQRFTVVSEAQSRTNPRARAVLLAAGGFFLAVAGMILLLACANVGGLFVARAHRRRTEMAVRASLGASRGRIVRMLLAEGIWPGMLGALLGVGIASWAVHAIGRVRLPVELPIRVSVDLAPPVVLASFAVAVAATLAFSLLPATGSARPDVAGALRAGSGGIRARFFSLRNALVIFQCSASAILVLGAMLFVRTLSVSTEADLGYDHDGVAVATHRLPESMSPEEGVQALRDLRERLDAQEGVQQVALSSALELTLFLTLESHPVEVAGYEATADGAEPVFHNAVTPGYLELLAVPMVAGRTILESDGPGARPIAVINETFADRYWPGLDPIGRTFGYRAGTAAQSSAGSSTGVPDDTILFEVVGVARNGAYLDFDDGPMPYFWSSIYQDFQPHVAVAVKGAGPAHAHLDMLRREVVPDDGVVQMMAPSVLADQVSIQFLHLRVLSTLLAWGGFFGLFLAAIGIYGVVSFAVTQRAKEMAIRVALGAEQRGVVRSVAMDGMRLAAVGLAVGVLLAIPVAGLLQGLLHGVSPTDPRALLYALGPLVAVAILASVVPARRITRVDPMVTLRSE